MRIVTGAIVHETSTFTPVPTTKACFYARLGVLSPDEIITKLRGVNTPTGGFIEGADVHGFELIPTIMADAYPSGPATRDVFDAILEELLEGVRNAGDIDGVLLELHGSMVIENLDDGEGYILSAVRDLVGPKTPVVAQLDIHSNVSHQMVEMADVLIGRESYPEVDMAPRGRECADVLVRIIREGLRPTMALHQIPMMWGMNQVTAHSPMKEAIEELHRIESLPGVVCGSIATCFPLADVPDLGASVYIVTENDQSLAQQYADELGDWLFHRKASWHFHMLSTREALATIHTDEKMPVIFADRDDNTGGGSPGDSTGMLKTFIEAELEDACILYIVDTEAVNQCMEAGIGATVALEVGGKSSPLQGHPISMTVEIMALSDGRFRYHGPMLAGLEGDMGPSAYIREKGIHVLLVSEREQPFDTAFSETLGLDPRQMRFIGVKSSAHFRAGFESWAGAIHVVTEPGVHDASHVSFHRLSRKIYPIDDL
ncbi:MAG: M81 family metallopeptidase [Candidatus Latescibacteria bacterium]|jgi:microcystin degradation protein MlrC|nr:M81 family metallopeptidase [Candidatus Latescibacterota bacterium]